MAAYKTEGIAEITATLEWRSQTPKTNHINEIERGGLQGPNQVVFESVNCPDPGPDQVVVNVTQSGSATERKAPICGANVLRGYTLATWRPAPLSVIAGYQKQGLWIG